ncbi:MAG: hypothetical protein IKB44_02530 [Clostridia bacterium]|nr:hypothetical protein [Clostridia bacterium]MBR2472811.1 hypothetical protein [Clostridia bacterium]
MKKILKKLSSRKLWTAIVGIATGLGIIFGIDQGAVSTLSGAVVAVLSVVSYIVTEGKIDAASVADAIEKVQQAGSALTKE